MMKPTMTKDRPLFASVLRGRSARLKVEQGGSLFLTELPDGYRISVYDEELGVQLAEARDIMRKRRNALRELAK